MTASREALLSGAPVPAVAGSVRYTNVVDDEPLWTVPATCPECGARVDQATASMAEHPRCEFCRKPLPCERIHYEEDYRTAALAGGSPLLSRDAISTGAARKFDS